MNIALFLDCFSPMKNGVITSALQLYEGLKKNGHNVYIVAIHVEGYVNDNPDFLLFPIIPLDFGSKQGFGYAKINKKKLKKFLIERNIDIIHIHTEYGVGYAGKNMAKKLKVPLIATTHTMWEQYSNYMFLFKFKFFTRTFLKNWVGRASVIVSPSIKAKKYYDLFVPDIPKVIIPNGIDTSKFRNCDVSEGVLDPIRAKYNITKEDKVFIFVGRIGPEKRVDELLCAAISVMKQDSTVKLMFVGDGPGLQNLMAVAEKQNVLQQCIFTGFIKWEEIFRLYKISYAFITASLSEVHPMTAIEGIMSSLPCITRKDDSYGDLVYPLLNGYLCDTDEDLSKAMIELSQDTSKHDTYSKASLEISKKFEVAEHVEKMENLYKTVLQNNGTYPV